MWLRVFDGRTRWFRTSAVVCIRPTPLRGDASSQSYAMALAIGQNNSNDAAWSLGMIQINNRHTVDLIRAANSRGSQASRELTDALGARDHARAVLATLGVSRNICRCQLSHGAKDFHLLVAQRAMIPFRGRLDGDERAELTAGLRTL